jgi:hypothetical protein
MSPSNCRRTRKKPRKCLRNVNAQSLAIFSSEVIHHSEDSDGISVISESELCKTMSENEEKGEETATDDERVGDVHLPLTPPATPSAEVEENNESEPCFIHNNPRNFIFGAGLFAIIAIFYSHVNSLRSDIEKCDQRLQRLEEENQMLKTALEQLEKLNQPQDELIDMSEIDAIVDDAIFSPLYEEEPRKPPPTKTVWLGSETEHKVEILDRKHELPDFCFHTEEDDLFFEYNQELCEQKRRKLDKTAKEAKKKKKLQKQPAWDEASYDKYIEDTLKSLNDEIQEIKRVRNEPGEETSAEKAENPKKFKENSKKPQENRRNSPENQRKPSEKPRKSTETFEYPKNIPEKPRKSYDQPEQPEGKAKRRKPKRKDRNWIEDRMNGREEARKTHQKAKENEENWYLNRKNERELDRLQS